MTDGPQRTPEPDRRDAIVAELARLYDLTVTLRRECPWDRKQTQEDIVTYTLEETYELVDAVRTQPRGHRRGLRRAGRPAVPGLLPGLRGRAGRLV